jgi:hypothetical protein
MNLTKLKRLFARNKNDVRDRQEIATSFITVPVLGVGSITYAPFNLAPEQSETVTVEYPENAVSDPEYLLSLRTSPLNVGTHELNTGEGNKYVDGWVIDSWYDNETKQAVVKAVIIGQAEIDYIKNHKEENGFGASGFISFDKFDTAENGNIILEKITNQHIAITENVRDPKLKIRAMNSTVRPVNRNVDQNLTTSSVASCDEKVSNNNNLDDKGGSDMEPSEVEKIVNGILDKRQSSEATNAEMEGMKEEIASIKNAVNEIKEVLKPKEDDPPEPKAENQDGDDSGGEDKPKTDDELAEIAAANAFINDDLLSKVADKTGLTFEQKPKLIDLAHLLGLKQKKPMEIITAINAFVEPKEQERKFSGDILSQM